MAASVDVAASAALLLLMPSVMLVLVQIADALALANVAWCWSCASFSRHIARASLLITAESSSVLIVLGYLLVGVDDAAPSRAAATAATTILSDEVHCPTMYSY